MEILVTALKDQGLACLPYSLLACCAFHVCECSRACCTVCIALVGASTEYCGTRVSCPSFIQACSQLKLLSSCLHAAAG